MLAIAENVLLYTITYIQFMVSNNGQTEGRRGT